MKVHKPHGEIRQEVPKTKDKPEVGPFAKVLEVKRKESIPQFALASEGQPSGLLPQAIRQPEPAQSSLPSTDIQRLASEIVDHIASRQTVGGSKSIDIQFNSQTLEGLRVNVLSQAGSITVMFVAPAARVAGLVQKNVSELRASLEGKGIRVAQIRVSRRLE